MARVWVEELPVMLTEAELLERGELLALQDKRWSEVDSKRKLAADDFKAKLTEIESETARLAAIVREKREPRPVEVVEVRNFTENRVDVVRKDTGEIVRTRVMTDAERQIELMPKADSGITSVNLGGEVLTREDAEAITASASKASA